MVALVILITVAVKKGWIVSAIVNGQPIFSWQLQQVLSNRYGKQTLEGMITERLITSEANKNGITVSQKDITNREEEMIKSFGGNVSIDEVVKYQGITRSDFDHQIQMQLYVENILSKSISFTDNELDNYIATNSARFEATDTAKMREEAKKMLVNQEISKKVQPWFNDLKSKAKIVTF